LFPGRRKCPVLRFGDTIATLNLDSMAEREGTKASVPRTLVNRSPSSYGYPRWSISGYRCKSDHHQYGDELSEDLWE
jgi:hypothetical protein